MIAAPPSATPSRFARRILLVLIVVLFGIPIGYSSLCHEFSNWKVAASFEQMLRGDFPGAVDCLDTAIRWTPDWAALYVQRANLYVLQGDAKSALPDCDRAMELARADWASTQSPEAHTALAFTLNHRAYTYALHRSNFEEALQNVDEAISIVGSEYGLLDTRGYLYLLLGRLKEAEDDLELAVQLAEISYKPTRNNFLSLRRDTVDQRPIDYDLQRLRDSFAVIYHHRGELYQALERQEDADRDLARAERLGYNPAKGVW